MLCLPFWYPYIFKWLENTNLYLSQLCHQSQEVVDCSRMNINIPFDEWGVRMKGFLAWIKKMNNYKFGVAWYIIYGPETSSFLTFVKLSTKLRGRNFVDIYKVSENFHKVSSSRDNLRDCDRKFQVTRTLTGKDILITKN